MYDDLALLQQTLEALIVRLEVIRAHVDHRHLWREWRDTGWLRCARWECVADAGLPDGHGPYVLHKHFDPTTGI